MKAKPEAINQRSLMSRLASHRAELEKMGVHSLALFGSFPGGTATADSDVDILVDIAPDTTLFAMSRVEAYLSDLVGRKVDLVPRQDLKPRLKSTIEEEAVRVF